MKNYQLPLTSGLIVDNFAGGGGASTGIERALKRPVNIAINHSAKALAMHEANHPLTKHYCEDVWDVNPREVCKGRPVDLAWFSPDCKHFSKAKGGALVDKKIRGLAWVALRWAATVKPRVICLENVEEFVTWGPVLENGKPCPLKKGKEFRSFVNALKRQDYKVEWKNLKACDYGAPTIRKRLFLIARCDNLPIVWPKPTHASFKSPKDKPDRVTCGNCGHAQLKKNANKCKNCGCLPYRTAAECIDWSDLGTSIFERKRPLAENTMRRIAKGLKRYVIDAHQPFIVPVCHGEAKGQIPRTHDIHQPLPTITAKGKHAIVTAILTEHANGSSQRVFDVQEPLRTQCAQVKGGHFALVSAFLVKHFGGFYEGTGSDIREPLPTIVGRNNQNQLITAFVSKMRGTNIGQDVRNPLQTITSSGNHHAQVTAFLTKFYGCGTGQKLTDPIATITAKDKIGLVTIHGEDYQIVDIRMRMLTARELFNAHNFGPGYIIKPIFKGKPLTETDSKTMVGNSVCPDLSEAIAADNCNFVDLENSLRERITA